MDAPSAKPPRRRAGSLLMLLGGSALAIALVVLLQREMAEGVGGWIADVWVSTMAVVVSILGAFLGG